MKKILYINAGAGSGKTFRLTHDLPNFLTDNNISPSEVIVTTFTVAAAEEIRERARKVLLEKGRADEASQLDTAAIGTIHSVCQQFIRKYWYAIGMAPNPDVLSSADKQIYRNQSIAGLLKDDRFSNEQKAIERYYNEFKPQHKLDGYSVAYPEFWTEMLDQMVGKLAYYDIKGDKSINDSIRASKQEVGAFFKSRVQPDSKEFKKLRQNAINLIREHINQKADKATADEKNKLTKLQKVPEVLTYSSLLGLMNISAFVEKIHELEGINETLNSWATSTYYRDIIYDLIDSLFNLALAWQKEYDTFKKAHCVIDYDDMERGMLALLKNKEICAEIGRNYKLVMVDEFQDCNPIQLRIFDLLSEAVAVNSPLEQSTIWVGDPKQAIYSFRGSNTDLINRVARKFPKKVGKTNKDGLKRDELDTSYRSRECLVNLANKAFHRDTIFPDMVELKYTVKEMPKYMDAVHHLQIKEKDRSNDDYYLNLARYIKDMVEGKEYEILPKNENVTRPLQYGDVALLVRNNKTARDIAYEMMCAQVPAFVPECDIWDRAEVQLVMSLLRLTEKPESKVWEHEIASLLRLWNDMSTEDILADRISFCANTQQDKKEWKLGAKELQSLFVAIDAVKEKPFDKKVTDLILLLSLKDKVAKWGQSDIRRANLCTLERAAIAFCQRCDKLGLEKNAVEFGIYLREGEIDVAKTDVKDAVKIVTYHGSKGLEWPLVMLLDLDKHFTGDNDVKKSFFGVNEQMVDGDSDDIIPSYRLIVNPNFLGDRFPDCFKTIANDNSLVPRFSETREAARKDAMRLLYVGMTRAREYLFTVSKGEKIKLDWFEAIGLNGKNDDLWDCGIKVKIKYIDPILKPYPSKPKTSTSQKPEKVAEKEAKLAEWENEKKAIDAENAKEFDRHTIPLGTYKLLKTADLKVDEYKVRNVYPSKLQSVDNNASFEKYELENVQFFPQNVDSSRYAALGTCIHNAFAAYNPNYTREQTLSMFNKVIANHGFANSLLSICLYNSITALYKWLTGKYGEGEVTHEVPFKHYREDGTFVIGEMDLLWKTAEGIVLVDFKNFVSDKADAVLDQSNKDHYVGKYVPQLTTYRNALIASGKSVKSTLIYYSIMGVIIDVNLGC